MKIFLWIALLILTTFIESPIMASEDRENQYESIWVFPVPKLKTKTILAQELITPSTPIFYQFSIGQGANSIGYQQTGAFGGTSGDTITPILFTLNGELKKDAWLILADFSQYNLDLGTNTSKTNEQTKIKIQDLHLAIGYHNIIFGVHQNQAPIMRTLGSTNLIWAKTTTNWTFTGLHLEKSNLIPFLSSFKFNFHGAIEYPISSSGNEGMSTSSLSGYGFDLKLGTKKVIYNTNHYQLLLGAEASTLYRKIKYVANWSDLSGTVEQKFQNYQGLVKLILEL